MTRVKSVTVGRAHFKAYKFQIRCQEASEWIESVTSLKTGDDVGEGLKDGVVLCKVLNALKPGAVAKVHQGGEGKPLNSFKMMDNVNAFLGALKSVVKVPDHVVVTAGDVVEVRQLPKTIDMLEAIANNANAQGLTQVKWPSAQPAGGNTTRRTAFTLGELSKTAEQMQSDEAVAAAAAGSSSTPPDAPRGKPVAAESSAAAAPAPAEAPVAAAAAPAPAKESHPAPAPVQEAAPAAAAAEHAVEAKPAAEAPHAAAPAPAAHEETPAAAPEAAAHASASPPPAASSPSKKGDHIKERRPPGVMWAQGNEVVFVTFEAYNVADPEIDVEEGRLRFRGEAAEKSAAVWLEVDMPLFGNIDVSHTKMTWSHVQQKVLLELPKLEVRVWPRLLTAAGRPGYLRVDWDHYEDVEDEPDA